MKNYYLMKIKEYSSHAEALIGVGSVLNGKMASDAIEAGAKVCCKSRI